MTPPLSTPTRPGLYSSPGWTERLGIAGLLEPLLLRTSADADFARFEALGAEEAESLLEIVPEDALEDRQNNGPRLVELLRLALERPGVCLSGYLISPPRWDERITVDGLLIPATDDLPEALASDPLVLHKWPRIRRALGLVSASGDPDEILALPHGRGGMAWWIWWD